MDGWMNEIVTGLTDGSSEEIRKEFVSSLLSENSFFHALLIHHRK